MVVEIKTPHRESPRNTEEEEKDEEKEAETSEETLSCRTAAEEATAGILLNRTVTSLFKSFYNLSVWP